MNFDTSYVNIHGDVNARTTVPEFKDAQCFDEYMRSLQVEGLVTEEVLHEVLLALTKDTRHGVLPSSLTASFTQGNVQDGVLQEISSYMHSDLYEEKFVFVTSPLDSVARALAICVVRPTDCTMAVSGVGDSHHQMENFLANLTAAVEPIIQGKKPEYALKVARMLPMQPPPADLGLRLARNAYNLICNEMKLPSSGNKMQNTEKKFVVEWHLSNATEAEDIEDEGNKDEEGPETEGQNKGAHRSFDFDGLDDKMSKIDLEDDVAVKAIVADVLTDEKRDAMALTEDHENLILFDLPKNEASVSMMENDPEILEAVLTFRGRIREVVNRLAILILCLHYPDEVTPSLEGFAMFCMANADKEHRSRLVHLLTHPSVIPIGLQYILGLKKWTVDQFDGMVHLTADAKNHFLTAYGGVAHCLDMQDFLYAGSATSILYSDSLVGESKRMRDHQRMMQKGQEMISELRRRGDQQCLFVHEKMSESGNNWFFFPIFRYLLKQDDPVAWQKSALALFAENCMMIFLSSVRKGHITRRGSNQWYASITRKILHALRPGDFPIPPWDGANIVLPMLQSPSSLWNLFTGRLRNVKLTPELKATLEQHFQSDHRPWLSTKTCSLILEQHGYTIGSTSIKALADFYAKVLKDHDLEYENLHQRYLKKYCILYVGIIKVAEDLGQVSRSVDGDYIFNADNVPWDKVAKEAQKVVPNHWRHEDYTADACESLYKSPKSAYFNQQVLNPVNWEMLRQTFAHIRPRARYGQPMNSRIWTVCRHFLYKHLAENNKLVESDDMSIRLHTVERATKLNSLLEEIIRQLQEDVALDPQIRNMDGLWVDESFKIKLLAELYSGFHELEVGVHRDIARKWSTLEKLKPRWAFPLFSVATAGDTTLREQMGGPDLAKQDSETRAKAKRLLASHVEPGLVAAQVSTATPKTQGQTESEDAEGDTKVGIGSDAPFEVRHKGKGPLKNMFSRPSEQLASDSGSSSVPTRKSTTRKNMPPWVDNICPDCGDTVEPGQPRASHKSRCLGKCNRCAQEGLACILRPKGKGRSKGTCKECFDKTVECERPDLTTMNLYGAGVCNYCGEWKRDIKKHQKSCDGNEDSQHTEDFVSKKSVCEDCGRQCGAYALTRHKKNNCSGRCTNCKNREPMTACERQTSSKGPCKECKKRGEEQTCDAVWRK